MNGLNLLETTISELSPLIRDRKLSPVELTEACIGQCERLDPTLHTFITMTPEYALQRAGEAEKEIRDGHYRGPLHGIPYTLKDVLATHGIRTTFGNPRLIDFKPAEHATVHSLLEEAGAVLLGKVYSHIGRGDNPVMCSSPWDPTTSPGTSSSGSGSAVASGSATLSACVVARTCARTVAGTSAVGSGVARRGAGSSSDEHATTTSNAIARARMAAFLIRGVLLRLVTTG